MPETRAQMLKRMERVRASRWIKKKAPHRKTKKKAAVKKGRASKKGPVWRKSTSTSMKLPEDFISSLQYFTRLCMDNPDSKHVEILDLAKQYGTVKKNAKLMSFSSQITKAKKLAVRELKRKVSEVPELQKEVDRVVPHPRAVSQPQVETHGEIIREVPPAATWSVSTSATTHQQNGRLAELEKENEMLRHKLTCARDVLTRFALDFEVPE